MTSITKFHLTIKNLIVTTISSIPADIIKGTICSFAIQIGFACLSFVTTTVLARLLGLEGYGAYSNAFAWVNILATFGMLGLNSILTREIAILKAQNQWELVRGLVQFSDFLVLSVTVFLVLLLWGVGGLVYLSPEKANLRVSLWIAAPLIPLYALINLRQSAMRGLQNVILALLPDYIIRPGLVLVSIICVYLFFPIFANFQSVLEINIAVSFVALMVSLYWLRTLLPHGFGKIQPKYHLGQWIKSTFHMFVIGGMQILIAQLPIILLGMLSDEENIGQYSAALRIASLLIFITVAINVVMGPIIASLYSQGEKKRLQDTIKRINRLSFGITFFISLVFIGFGKTVLSLFGQEFHIAYKALILLVIGYLVDSGFGISIITLMMTGHESIVAIYQTFFTLALVVLCLALIPSEGFEGAALAFASVMIGSRFIFAICVKKKTGINTTIF